MKGIIRQAKFSDLAQIAQIESESDYIGTWTLKKFSDEINNQTSQIMIFQKKSGKLISGFLIFQKAADTLEIINIAVTQIHQGLGIGSRLIDWLVKKAQQDKINEIFLEVRHTNVKAIKLYSRFGFKQVGIRKNYYKKPQEDALVMKKSPHQLF